MTTHELCLAASRIALDGVAEFLGHALPAAEVEKFLRKFSEDSRFAWMRAGDGVFIAVRRDSNGKVTIAVLFSASNGALGDAPEHCVRTIESRLSGPFSPVRGLDEEKIYVRFRTDVDEAELEELEHRYSHQT